MFQDLITTYLANEFVILQLILALLLGISLGTERTLAKRTAGIRTYALVTLGCCLLVILGQEMDLQYLGRTNFEPNQIASAIVTGIGFLGTGMIIFQERKLSGLTTAAGLWIAAAVGIAVGYGRFELAVTTTLLTLFTFSILWVFEQKIRKIYNQDGLLQDDEHNLD